MANKTEYFEYFHHNHKLKKSANIQHIEDRERPKTSQYEIAQLHKLLPHITEEYQYRITNDLLRYKIAKPRRDKIIMEAVQSAYSRQTSSYKKRRPKTQQRFKENHYRSCHFDLQSNILKNPLNSKELNLTNSPSKKKQLLGLYKTFQDKNSTSTNQKNDYLISLQNTRMGKRLINAKSVVSDILTKTYYTYQIYNGKLVNKDKYMSINRNSLKFRNGNRNFGKINNGIKSFFKNEIIEGQHRKMIEESRGKEDYQNNLNKIMLLEDKSLRKIHKEERNCRTNSYACQTKNPFILETYGNGDYIFVIKRLSIRSNPPLKPGALLVLQAFQSEAQLNSTLNRDYSQQHGYCNRNCKTEKENQQHLCFTTSSFTYDYISTSSERNLGIKFRVHRIRQIFIRILRNEGIRQLQLGAFRINLQHFFNRKKCDMPFETYEQEREIDGVAKKRQIFESEYEGNLYKLKVGQTNTEIRIEYLFYSRHFKTQQTALEQTQRKQIHL